MMLPWKAKPALACAVAGVAATLVTNFGLGLPREQAYMAGIFMLAALLWLTQAVPLFATSVLIITLKALLLANPGEWPGLGFDPDSRADPLDYGDVLRVVGSPIMVLFFGGFVLAAAMVKEGVDKSMAAIIVRPFGGKPRASLAAVMVATAFFSMWMSNTAATAMMITLAGAMMSRVAADEPFRRALILGVAFAANIGGMGTPIGTPPNAIALDALRQRGIAVSFAEWMLIAVPLAAGLLVLAWLLLVVRFRPNDPALDLRPESRPMTRRAKFTLIVFATTVVLWLSQPLHGVPSHVVALVPAVIFTCTGIIGRVELNNLEWNVLILIAGGLAMGLGMQAVGLDVTIADAVTGSGITNAFLVIAGLATVTLLLSNFMSNTAAANLILPVGVTIMTVLAGEAGVGAESQLVVLAVSLALVASIAMSLPVSTPPNAIAFGTNAITTRELATNGTLISVVALVLIIAFGGTIISFWHAMTG
jgi:sodium-dependent dicarboxylate transporter 2/3/5